MDAHLKSLCETLLSQTKPTLSLDLDLILLARYKRPESAKIQALSQILVDRLNSHFHRSKLALTVFFKLFFQNEAWMRGFFEKQHLSRGRLAFFNLGMIRQFLSNEIFAKLKAAAKQYRSEKVTLLIFPLKLGQNKEFSVSKNFIEISQGSKNCVSLFNLVEYHFPCILALNFPAELQQPKLTIVNSIKPRTVEKNITVEFPENVYLKSRSRSRPKPTSNPKQPNLAFSIEKRSNFLSKNYEYLIKLAKTNKKVQQMNSSKSFANRSISNKSVLSVKSQKKSLAFQPIVYSSQSELEKNSTQASLHPRKNISGFFTKSSYKSERGNCENRKGSKQNSFYFDFLQNSAKKSPFQSFSNETYEKTEYKYEKGNNLNGRRSHV